MFPLRLSLFALLLLAVLGLSQEADASSVTGIEYPDGKVYRTESYEINVTVDDYQEGDTLELEYYSPNKEYEEKLSLGTAKIRFSDDGRYAVAKHGYMTVTSYDMENQDNPLWTTEDGDGYCISDITPNGTYFLARLFGDIDATVLVETLTGNVVQTYDYNFCNAEFSGNGEFFIYYDYAADQIRFYETFSNSPKWSYSSPDFFDFEMNHNASKIAALSDSKLLFFNNISSSPVWEKDSEFILPPQDRKCSLSMSIDKPLLSVLDGSKTNNGGNIALYNSTTGEVIWETNTNSENENYDCQQISKDGDYIVGIRQFNHGINIPFLFNTSSNQTVMEYEESGASSIAWKSDSTAFVLCETNMAYYQVNMYYSLWSTDIQVSPDTCASGPVRASSDLTLITHGNSLYSNNTASNLFVTNTTYSNGVWKADFKSMKNVKTGNYYFRARIVNEDSAGEWFVNYSPMVLRNLLPVIHSCGVSFDSIHVNDTYYFSECLATDYDADVNDGSGIDKIYWHYPELNHVIYFNYDEDGNIDRSVYGEGDSLWKDSHYFSEISQVAGRNLVHMYVIDYENYNDDWDNRSGKGMFEYADDILYGVSEPFIFEYYIYDYPTGEILVEDSRQVVLNNSIPFSGTGSDADGDVSYTWASSKDGNLSNEASFEISTLSVGWHTIYFNVTDEHGNVHTNTTSVEVIVGPIAVIMGDNHHRYTSYDNTETSLGYLFTIESASYHPELSSIYLEHNWTVCIENTCLQLGEYNNPYFELTGDTEQRFREIRVYGYQSGIYTVTLTVTDENGLQDETSMNVTVQKAPRYYLDECKIKGDTFPIGNKYLYGTSFDFTCYFEDEDGYIDSYSWTSSLDGELSTELNFSKQLITIGFHYIIVEAIDNDGYTTTWGNNIEINYVPVALAGADVQVEPGEDVQYLGSGTVQGGSIVNYEWDFNGDGIYDWSADSGIATFKFNNEGVYTSILRVTDENGHNATDTMIVAVGVEIPVPEPTQNNSTSEKDDGDELNPMFLVIGAIALIGAGGAAYFYTRDTTDYSAIRTSTVEEKKPETGRKKVLKSFVPKAELVSIECPGCDAQMKVPKLNELQEVTCSACGLSGDIEI